MKLRYVQMPAGEGLDIDVQNIDGPTWRITPQEREPTTIVIRDDRNNDGSRSVVFEVILPSSGVQTLCGLPTVHTERGIEISFSGRTYVFREAGATPVKESRASSGLLVAPMVGVVVEVFVSEGDVVAAYQPLAVVEAMKVMATLEAPFAGTVERIFVPKGARVGHGDPVISVVESLVESDPELNSDTSPS